MILATLLDDFGYPVRLSKDWKAKYLIEILSNKIKGLKQGSQHRLTG
jgi:hypothetical protein